MALNKKGSVRDVGLAMVVLFSVGLISFLLLFVYNSANDIITEAAPIKGTAAEIVFDAGSTNLAKTDYITLAILIGFFVSIIALGWLSGGIPVFQIFYILFLVVIGVVSGLLTYVWETISDQAIFSTTLNSFPITDFILDHLTLFIVVIGFVGLIVMYIRGQGAVELQQ